MQEHVSRVGKEYKYGKLTTLSFLIVEGSFTGFSKKYPPFPYDAPSHFYDFPPKDDFFSKFFLNKDSL